MHSTAIHAAEIVCVGTELLLGDIVNTNAAYLAKQLAALGIDLYHESVVGDNAPRLTAAIRLALSRSDLVILCGGLGPTYDDITKETAAELLGLPLSLHAESLTRMQDYFTKTGRTMTENNKKQALIPAGATVLVNNNGTAPGILVEIATGAFAGRTLILLPGPPSELYAMFEESVLPYLRTRTESVLHSVNLHLIGIGESALEEILRERMTSMSNPTLAPYAGEGEVRLRITAKAADEESARALCLEEVERIKTLSVGQYIYGVDVGSLEQAVVNALTASGRTLALAESCTGGLIAKRLTDIPGSSAVLLGGCVTYAEEAKVRLVGVSPATLAEYGAVSEETALEMARGARRVMGADIGLATTGVAGPGGGDAKNPVGTVYLAIATEEGARAVRLSLSAMRSRSYIRTAAASRALALILGH